MIPIAEVVFLREPSLYMATALDFGQRQLIRLLSVSFPFRLLLHMMVTFPSTLFKLPTIVIIGTSYRLYFLVLIFVLRDEASL